MIDFISVNCDKEGHPSSLVVISLVIIIIIIIIIIIVIIIITSGTGKTIL